MAEVGEQNKNVGDFVPDVEPFFIGEILGLLHGFPEKVDEELPCFDGDGFGEVLGVVELMPVALGPE